MWPDTQSVSRRIVDNLRQMVPLVKDQGKRAILFDVPHVNERMFSDAMVRDIRAKRDYHNPRLREFYQRQALPLADICRLLRDEQFCRRHPGRWGPAVVPITVGAH